MSTIATTNIKEPSSATNNITLTSGGDTTISGNATVSGTLTFPPNAGQVLQVVNFQTGEYNSGTTVIPSDDTIPQNTEGTEFMTLAITPISATSKLLIEVSALLGTNTINRWVIGALFQDTTADALAATIDWESLNGTVNEVTLRHYMTAGTTSSTTFKFRAGLSAAGTVYFNGPGSRYFGGVAASSITITEIAT